MFIVKAEQYFEFDLFTSLPKSNQVTTTEHIIEFDRDSFKVCFRFIQAIERFVGTIIVKFLNVLCFGLIDLTSCLKKHRLSTFMTITGHLT